MHTSVTTLNFCLLMTINSVLATSKPVTNPAAIGNPFIQYETYIDKDSQTALTGSAIASASGDKSLIYNWGDSIANLGIGRLFSNFNASDGPDIFKYLPDKNVQYMQPADGYGADDVEGWLGYAPGYTAVYGSANTTYTAIPNFRWDDPIVSRICKIAVDGINTIQYLASTGRKASVVMMIDRTLDNGNKGEMFFSFETWGTPFNDALTANCTYWLADLIDFNTHPDDDKLRTGWRIIGHANALMRLGLGISEQASP